MSKLLQEYSTIVIGDDTEYSVRSYGEEEADGTWSGWIEFHPIDTTLPVLQTDQETSQPNETAVDYWATGLEPVYFEGAYERARPKL